MKFIIERQGWNQWLDDGDCLQSSREAAKEFSSLESAQEVATCMNKEIGEDQFIVVEV